MTNPFALYVHWPWCKAKCPYCDFNSHEGATREQDYVSGLLNELDMWHENRVIEGFEIAPFALPLRPMESVFFGGGTPSLMQPESIRQILEASQKLGHFSAKTEVTVECNPTSFENASDALIFFNNLKNAGVNRISIGLQGLEDEWLRFLGRTHSVKDALATLDAAQSVFSNVNADVIYGLPNQSPEAWEKQLKTLAQRGLTHISAYQLTIEKNTRFHHDVKHGLWEPISADVEADFFETTQGILTNLGYENYEISNFAKPGYACRHNVHVWRYGTYLGIGAGAHGRVDTPSGGVIATQVIRQPEGYLRRFEEGRHPLFSLTPLKPSEGVQEALFSGLRLAEGVDMEKLQKRFKNEACEEAISREGKAFLTQRGLLETQGNHLMLTKEGWPRLNAVLERLLMRLPPSDTPKYPPTPPTPLEYTTPLRVTFE